MPMDWIMGLVGGLLIGLAGAIYLLGNGRVMGASGIIGGLWTCPVLVPPQVLV